MNVTIRVWHFFIYFCSYFANIKHDLHFLNLKRKNFTVLDPNIFRTKKAYLYYDAIDIIYNQCLSVRSHMVKCPLVGRRTLNAELQFTNIQFLPFLQMIHSVNQSLIVLRTCVIVLPFERQVISFCTTNIRNSIVKNIK